MCPLKSVSQLSWFLIGVFLQNSYLQRFPRNDASVFHCRVQYKRNERDHNYPLCTAMYIIWSESLHAMHFHSPKALFFQTGMSPC